MLNKFYGYFGLVFFQHGGLNNFLWVGVGGVDFLVFGVRNFVGFYLVGGGVLVWWEVLNGGFAVSGRGMVGVCGRPWLAFFPLAGRVRNPRTARPVGAPHNGICNFWIYDLRFFWGNYGKSSSYLKIYLVEGVFFEGIFGENTFRIGENTFRMVENTYRIGENTFRIGGFTFRIGGLTFRIGGLTYRMAINTFRIGVIILGWAGVVVVFRLFGRVLGVGF